MTIRRLISRLLLTIVLAACTGTSMPVQNPEDEVRAAVYRYQVNRTPTTPTGAEARVYFIGVGDGDPPDTLLAHLRDLRHPVKPRSAASLRRTNPNDPVSRVFDRVSGIEGALYTTDELRWLTATRAEVFGCYGARCSTFMVESKDGVWTVIAERLRSIA